MSKSKLTTFSKAALYYCMRMSLLSDSDDPGSDSAIIVTLVRPNSRSRTSDN